MITISISLYLWDSSFKNSSSVQMYQTPQSNLNLVNLPKSSCVVNGTCLIIHPCPSSTSVPVTWFLQVHLVPVDIPLICTLKRKSNMPEAKTSVSPQMILYITTGSFPATFSVFIYLLEIPQEDLPIVRKTDRSLLI